MYHFPCLMKWTKYQHVVRASFKASSPRVLDVVGVKGTKLIDIYILVPGNKCQQRPRGREPSNLQSGSTQFSHQFIWSRLYKPPKHIISLFSRLLAQGALHLFSRPNPGAPLTQVAESIYTASCGVLGVGLPGLHCTLNPYSTVIVEVPLGRVEFGARQALCPLGRVESRAKGFHSTEWNLVWQLTDTTVH